MKRIAVLVNKGFEYEGFVEGLRDVVDVRTGTNGRDAECRFDNLMVDIYCIHRLFPEGESSSNSEKKAELLGDLFRSRPFRIWDLDGVVSVSTAESTPISQEQASAESLNGCVYVGNGFFLSDQHMKDPASKSHLSIGKDGTESYDDIQLCAGLYDELMKTEMQLKPVRMNSAAELKCVASQDFACVGVVNVMDYSKYKFADPAAYQLFLERCSAVPVSIETTHGVVKKVLAQTGLEFGLGKQVPVTFVSPITDRYTMFDDDVDKDGWQNFGCSYNGGIAVGNMLGVLDRIWR